MSLPLTETLISLKDAARRLPGRPHVSTLWRWSTRGVRNIRLETSLVGARRFTSLEAIARFLERINRGSDPTGGSNYDVKTRRTEIERAKQELEADGF